MFIKKKILNNDVLNIFLKMYFFLRLFYLAAFRFNFKFISLLMNLSLIDASL